MSKDDHWITSRITEIRKRHPLVTDAVSARMETLLKSQLSDGQLSSAELTKLASTLIADMLPASPKAQAKQ